MGAGYDPSAPAPLFHEFLTRVLPDPAVQKLLFQYIGYVFLRNMNLEKVLFLYGGGANGKSVFLNVIRNLIGEEQCCPFSLESITKADNYLVELGNYLLNVSTEISTRMKTAVFKQIASREPLQVRHLYGRAFVMRDYATSIFSMNVLPKVTEITDAFYRRFLIVPFTVRIPDEEQNPDLAKTIIASEMSGVLNLVIKGAESLLAEGKFDIPVVVVDEVDNFRKESDTVLIYLEENGYSPGTNDKIPLATMHSFYKTQHPNGVHKRQFSERLRSLGYEVKRYGAKNTITVFVTRTDG